MSVKVNVDNFKRAESDAYFNKFTQNDLLGRFAHRREPTDIDKQDVIRMNRDTLYSSAVVDLGASPATVTLPEAAGRFMALQVIDEDHYTVTVIYGAARIRSQRSRWEPATCCFSCARLSIPPIRRTWSKVHALQDALTLTQSHRGTFEVPDWDRVSLDKVRSALNALTTANGGLDSARMFGRQDQVDPVQHLLGTAAGWGGNPHMTRTTPVSNPRRTTGPQRTV
jgi:hypothetical protein